MEELEISKVNLDQHMVIEASAGTGKTYSLEHLVIRYIAEKGFDISQILAVTFTEKAALELKSRIMALLRKIINENGSLHKPDEIKRLRKAFISFSDAQIFTIHAFCQSCIKNYPFESRAAFRTAIMDSKDLYREAVLDYFRTAGDDLDDSYLSFRKNNKEFETAAEYFISFLKNPFMLDAGTGTDDDDDAKENIIIPEASVVRMLEENISMFDNATGAVYNAIQELKECSCDPGTVENISKTVKLGFRGGTFEKLSGLLRLLASSQSLYEIFSDDFISDSGKLWKLTLEFIRNKGCDPQILDEKSLQLVKCITAFFDSIDIFADKDETGSVINYIYHNMAGFAFIKKASEKIIRLAERKKKSASLLDFNDLIQITRDSVKNPDSALTEELMRKYRVVLVDEFQDTDLAQWEIFSKIFTQNSHVMILIGDPKQSIYRFRGADLEIYFRASEALPLVSRYRLATCYRSPDTVVKGINDIFSRVFSYTSGGGHRIEYKDVKSSDLVSADTGKTAEKKVIDAGIEILGIENSMESSSKGKISVIIENIYADEIALLLDSGTSPSDICVLMEANSDCKSMLDALKERNIPALYEGDIPLFESVEAAQFADFFYALSQPSSLPVLKKALFSDFFRFSSDDILKIEKDGSMEKIITIFSAWNGKTAAGHLHEVFDSVFYRENPFSEIADLNEADKVPYIARKLLEHGGEGKVSNILQIAEMMIVKNIQEKESAPGILRYLISVVEGSQQAEQKNIRLAHDRSCVKVMTIHKSKGLEFPVVFFAGGLGTSKPAPHRESWYEYIENGRRYIDFTKKNENRLKQFREMWEEKKRLYYVAMTRAAEKLYLPLIKNGSPGNLSSLYASLVFENLCSELENTGIAISLPLDIRAEHIPKKMKTEEAKSIVSEKIYFLVKQFCGERPYIKFTAVDIESNDCENSSPVSFLPDQKKKGELRLSKPDYDKKTAGRGMPVYSYSSLSKTGGGPSTEFEHQHGRIRHLEMKEEKTDDEKDIIEIEGIKGIRGADFGNIMHKILETADYSKTLSFGSEDAAAEDTGLFDLAVSSARNYVSSSLAELCSKSVVRLLYRTLNSRVYPKGVPVRIGDIPESDRNHEVEFLIKVKEGPLSDIPDMPNITLEDGYLKGYIDLVFRFDNSYYVVDWKTNYLGNSVRDYDKDNLEIAMKNNNYLLQMNLYMAALDLIVDSEKSCCSAEPGGCYYLFLRGLSGSSEKGQAGSGLPDSAVSESSFRGIYFSPYEKEKTAKLKKSLTGKGA
ncbi:MAG: UvrD-helicase domain-containing protein [Spirochaetia bacterium]|jgi:exodeoxyribonuclease V beta subunit|nr:UvrD-helicase domain-containing protein [Spirochaetia bacterium]